MRSTIAALTVGIAVFGISGVVAACSSDQYDGVCENTATQLRTDDKNCQQSGQGNGAAQFIWVYYGAGQRIPAVGSGVDDGTPNPPAGANLANGGVSSGGSDGGDNNGNKVGPANNGGDDDENGGSVGGDDGGDEGGSGGGGGDGE